MREFPKRMEKASTILRAASVEGGSALGTDQPVAFIETVGGTAIDCYQRASGRSDSDGLFRVRAGTQKPGTRPPSPVTAVDVGEAGLAVENLFHGLADGRTLTQKTA